MAARHVSPRVIKSDIFATSTRPVTVHLPEIDYPQLAHLPKRWAITRIDGETGTAVVEAVDATTHRADDDQRRMTGVFAENGETLISCCLRRAGRCAGCDRCPGSILAAACHHNLPEMVSHRQLVLGR